MQIQFGVELVYECLQPTPMILMLNAHSSRASDLVMPDRLSTFPSAPGHRYCDSFGNWCHRLMAPQGLFNITSSGMILDSGRPDRVAPQAQQMPVEELPEETITYLLGSRYCETDLLSDLAWRLFSDTAPGWPRVQAVCDFVHRHIHFSYEAARPTRTAMEVFREQRGVCRDFTHLAVTFCRCLNIPARYCTGYLGDIGMPPPYPPGDFAAWFEAYLDGEWYTFDPRNNERRIGRILVGRGRDAQDVPLSHTFGINTLKAFRVWCDEIKEEQAITEQL